MSNKGLFAKAGVPPGQATVKASQLTTGMKVIGTPGAIDGVVRKVYNSAFFPQDQERPMEVEVTFLMPDKKKSKVRVHRDHNYVIELYNVS